MFKAIEKYLALAAIVGLMLPGLVFDCSAATIPTESTIGIKMKAHVAFESPIAVDKVSDVTFSYEQTGPHDRVMLDAGGNPRLAGGNDVFAPYGRPSVMTISDSRGQILNFLLTNYSPGGGISSLHAHCALKGAENVACDTRPVFGERENTLFIGVDMPGAAGITPVDNKTVPSFDMSIVYQ